MDYKEAISVLTKMLDKHSLDAQEQAAVQSAIGLLDWASLGRNKMKNMMEKRKAKREKDVEW